MFRYETHLHTFPVSKCAKAEVKESLEFYQDLGYDGVFITNHFLDGNINIEKEKSYEEKLRFYFSDYEAAFEIAKSIGIKVFCAQELSYKGTDFLIYGLEPSWYFSHPEIMEMKKSDELNFMMESGALVIQAHPFREAVYIDHLRLYPRNVHGVEVVNACRKDEENRLAKIYAEHYNLLPFAGTDNHKGGNQKKLAGISFDQPIDSAQGFIEGIKERKGEIFTLTLE